MFAPTPSNTSAPASEPEDEGPRARRRSVRVAPYLYVAPALLLLGIWTYRPLIETIQLSFYDWNMLPTSPKTFVGVQNYLDVLALPDMQQAVVNTGVYVLAALVFLVAVPTVIVLLARGIGRRASMAYQAIIFLPYLMTPVATTAVWRWLFAEETGLISRWAAGVGVDLGNVFRDPDLSLWAIIAILGWQMIGFGVLMVTAGHTGISPDYAAAASVDGATESYTVRRVILPLLSPTLVFLGLMSILLVAQWSFPLIDILTGGGPGASSTNVYHVLYEYGFQSFDSGIAAAAGTLFFVAFGLIATLFVELSERVSFYDD
ncbi:carbohydrate ABC transporter permease [Salinibacterium sp. GXW1014]|uniref:carbohydrate ABC transporter permease n=1 Tax=Salinibacterium sp. GXW1014 TaxID=3377838 RepID=UPI003839F94D